MPRYDRSDILIELVELCRDIRTDIAQQLNYYRASVYKLETAQLIEAKVQQLQTVSALLHHDVLTDSFRDFQDMKREGVVSPGECLLSFRLMHLFKNMDEAFDQMVARVHQQNQSDSAQLKSGVQKHRRQLLALCKQGSRSWAFFNRL